LIGLAFLAFFAVETPILVASWESRAKPLETFNECSNCPQMIVVPAGSFTMGSPASETGHRDNEGPQHTVTIARPFAVGQFALTFDEWDACVADGGCDGYKPSDRWGRGRQP
jgi:formylglycine-generating enzyme required for sulfatase activity